jgi:hypothetical protein
VLVELSLQGTWIVAEALILHDAFFQPILDGHLDVPAGTEVLRSWRHGDLPEIG